MDFGKEEFKGSFGAEDVGGIVRLMCHNKSLLSSNFVCVIFIWKIVPEA